MLRMWSMRDWSLRCVAGVPWLRSTIASPYCRKMKWRSGGRRPTRRGAFRAGATGCVRRCGGIPRDSSRFVADRRHRVREGYRRLPRYCGCNASECLAGSGRGASGRWGGGRGNSSRNVFQSLRAFGEPGVLISMIGPYCTEMTEFLAKHRRCHGSETSGS